MEATVVKRNILLTVNLKENILLLIARHAEDPPLYSCYDVCVPLSVCVCVNNIVNAC